MLSIITFIGFTALVAFIAWYATRKTDETTADGYYLAGRSLGAITIAGSLLLTNLSAEQIVGLNGAAFKEGLMVMAWETLAAIAIIFAAIFLLPKYMKSGITTIPEFIETRFDKQTKGLLSLLFLIAYAIVLLPTILYSGSIAFSTMFDLPTVFGISEWSVIWICVWSIGIIGIIYAIYGGLKAVAVSDLINAIGLLVGGLLIPIFGLLLIGDGSIVDGLETLWNTNPEKFNMEGAVDSSIPFGTLFTGMMLAQIYYWGTNQSILQRVFAAKSLKEGQKGMMLAALIKFIIPIIVVVPGIIAFHVFGNELGNPDQAYPALVKKVLPTAFVGFFAAVLFGAVLSSFNSLLNSSATLFGFDLYKMYFKKDATEQETVKAGKRFGLLVAAISMTIAPFIIYAPDGLFSYIQQSLGSLSVPILAVVVVGVFSKKVPAIGAKIVLTLGVGLYLVSLLILEPLFRNAAIEEAMAQNITDAAQLSIIKAEAYPHYLHVMGILFVFNVLVMFITSKIKPKKDAYIPKVTDSLDVTPWRYTIVFGIIIAILVLGTYIIF
ncbi:solute:sodium symporter family transporter [Polaribacter dokdonensis]|uniref:Putative sodium/myo-inositol symporter n=1 Tax=Polaribacter dokdonensis DSW-5 TaxID=1300348 RepID=A0A0M9CEY4_9FLAO|nr:solute:sodium symporter family transporter [Polaribacter dokdonensis]KOY50545.1 putative sodium/myo-inositol symporter [Polaribacter dokdonensis DSW-5]SEE60550.1 solute:Na+ symporter, SSS family [Polaribacter dokdonensis DSW-5]